MVNVDGMVQKCEVDLGRFKSVSTLYFSRSVADGVSSGSNKPHLRTTESLPEGKASRVTTRPCEMTDQRRTTKVEREIVGTGRGLS